MKILILCFVVMLTGCATNILSPYEAAQLCDQQALKKYRSYDRDGSQEFECFKRGE